MSYFKYEKLQSAGIWPNKSVASLHKTSVGERLQIQVFEWYDGVFVPSKHLKGTWS